MITGPEAGITRDSITIDWSWKDRPVQLVDTGQDSNMGGTGRPHRTYFRQGNIAITNAGGLNGSLLLANVQIPGTVGADDTHGHGTGVCSITSG